MSFTCDTCGALFSRKFNLKRHQTSRCESIVVINTKDDAADAVKAKGKDSQWPSFINDIINKKSESGDAMIQPLKSLPMSYAVKKSFDTSLSKKEPVEEILTGCETEKSLNIFSTESEKSSEDESITEHPLVKKRKLMSTDDAGTLMKAEEEEHNDTADDNLNPENENIDPKQEGKDEYDENEDGDAD